MLTYDQLIKSDASNPEAVKAITALLGVPTGAGANFYSDPKIFADNLANLQRKIGEQVAGTRGSSPSGEFQKFGEYAAWGGDVAPLQAQLAEVKQKYANAGVDFSSSPLSVLEKIAGLSGATPQGGSRVTSQNYQGGEFGQQPQPITNPTTTRLNTQTGLLEKVPVSTAVADQLPMNISSTISPNQLTNNTSLSGFFPTAANNSSITTVQNIGNLGLSALDQALFQFQAQQQQLATTQRTAAETALAQAQQNLANTYNTSREAEISRVLKETGIKEKQAALSDLKTKMAQAQEALNLGLQQEGGRIAPMSIIGRRQQLLVEQAQGKIGALAAIANVYADDLDQAWNVANLTIDAMNHDRQEKIDAYQFLIKANESKIVNLKAEEKEAINSQISILREAQSKAEENKNKVMELISKNPIEAQKGKVSLTDSYEEAFAKIQPLVAKKTEQEYSLQLDSLKLDNAYKQAQIANIRSEIANRGGGGGGNNIDPMQIIAYAQQYASTGQIPTGIPKGSFGLISATAQGLPKPTGTIVDSSTGVHPSKLNGTQLDGISALYDVLNKAQELKDLDKKRIGGIVPGILGKVTGSKNQTNYMATRAEIVDLLSRARSGAALTETEINQYEKKLPGRFSEPFFLGADSQVKIDNFIKSIKSSLNSKLQLNGVNITGYDPSTGLMNIPDLSSFDDSLK